MSARILPPANLSPRGLARPNRGLAALLFLLAVLFRGVAEETGLVDERTEIHFAYSKAMFVDVNENDAKAAVKVYARNIGAQNGIYVDSLPELPDGTNAIARLLELKKTDVLILTAEEFFALENQGLEGPLLLANAQGSYTEDYLLLSRTDKRPVACLDGTRQLLAEYEHSRRRPTANTQAGSLQSSNQK